MKGHIAKKKTGENTFRYYPVIDTVDENGKRKRKWLQGFEKKKDAQSFLNDKLSELQKGIYVEPAKTTLAEYFEYWLKQYAEPNTAPRTYEGYESMIRNHLSPGLGRHPLDKLKPIHIQSYYNEKMKSGLSAQTVLHHHRLLNKILKQAVIWELLIRNPAEAITPPKPVKYEAQTYTPEQLHILFAEAETTQYYEAIFLGANTGMRQGEVLGLQWKNVDLDKRLIMVRTTLQRVVGKGLMLKEVPKTKSSRRTIKVSESVCDVLRKAKLKQARNKMRHGEDYQDLGYVFTQENGKPFEPTELRRLYRAILKKAELPHIRFHDLRHTFATLLLESGEVDIKTVQEMLGHSTMWITGDIYSHVTPKMQDNAVDVLERKLSTKPSTKTSTINE